MEINVKAYDHNAVDDIIHELFWSKDIKTDETRGLIEIPAASYQLIISGLKCAAWMPDNREDRDIIRKACSLLETMRDNQKQVEWRRATQ